MTQMTTVPADSHPVPAAARAAGRKMRHERLVSLRTPMPLGLLTLRHDVPEWLGHDVPDFQTETTSKVVLAPREVETTARRA
jgi:hypothetical protein